MMRTDLVEEVLCKLAGNRRLKRVTAKPARFDPAAYANEAVISLSDEPKTLKEVRARPDAVLWERAMQEDFFFLFFFPVSRRKESLQRSASTVVSNSLEDDAH